VNPRNALANIGLEKYAQTVHPQRIGQRRRIVATAILGNNPPEAALQLDLDNAPVSGHKPRRSIDAVGAAGGIARLITR
jgi:hypothetical protein